MLDGRGEPLGSIVEGCRARKGTLKTQGHLPVGARSFSKIPRSNATTLLARGGHDRGEQLEGRGSLVLRERARDRRLGNIVRFAERSVSPERGFQRV
eukprot:13521412-Alexandrium_andersonii.AAC.1